MRASSAAAWMTWDNYERVSLSESARVLLCDLAAGDLARPLSELCPDWEEVFQGVCRNGLLGLTYRYMTRGASRGALPEEFRRSVQRSHVLRVIDMRLMYRSISTVLASLAGAQVDCILLKGPALAYQI